LVIRSLGELTKRKLDTSSKSLRTEGVAVVVVAVDVVGAGGVR